MITELEAVNRILKGTGIAPVNSLDTPQVPEEALRAQSILQDTAETILSDDWKFNTVFDLEFEPNGDGEVVITGYTYVEFDDCHAYDMDPVMVGTNVFDRRNNTNTITGTIKVRKAVRDLGWEYAPKPIQLYILKRAENDFVSTVLGDPEAVRHTQEDLMQSYVSLNKFRTKTTNQAFISVPSVLSRDGYPVGRRTSRLSGGRW